MAIKTYDILKMIEIDIEDISEELINFLHTCKPSYQDQLLDEHLYRIEDIWEKQEEEGNYPENIKDELVELEKLLVDKDCTYFRIYIP